MDIQIPLGDDEVMGWKAQVDCQEVTQEYDEGKDVEFYGDKATAKFTVPAGHFAVFFPSDAHQPGIAPGKEYRKLIENNLLNLRLCTRIEIETIKQMFTNNYAY